MCFTFLILCVFMHISTVSQDLMPGFYQIIEDKNGFPLKDWESDEIRYLRPQPILILEDVEHICSAIVSSDITYALNFKLNNIGAEKAKKFSQENGLVMVALVLEDRILLTKSYEYVQYGYIIGRWF
jgi:hypothetical protein